mgnify:CR=1 FL=1
MPRGSYSRKSFRRNCTTRRIRHFKHYTKQVLTERIILQNHLTVQTPVMLPGSSAQNRHIAIVGVGQVGGAIAYGLILQSLASELLLVDEDIERRDGQVRDLSDVSYGHGSQTRVRPATHREAGQCDIVIITAGSKYTLGMIAVKLPLEHSTISQSVSRPN